MTFKKLLPTIMMTFGLVSFFSPVFCFFKKSDAKKTADTEQKKEISQFSGLPKIGKGEYLFMATKNVFPLKFIGNLAVGHDYRLKQLLKAVMYLNGRLSAIEKEMGIDAPNMSKITSVRKALGEIKRQGKAIATSQGALNDAAATEQQLTQEAQNQGEEISTGSTNAQAADPAASTISE